MAEADAVLVRASSEVEDDSEENKASEGEDLDEREPELDLAEHANAEQVDKDHDADHERDPDRGV